ncbi:MAG: alpha,alpha-trehalose-phosphate synthase (UDP-forming), partial [Gammaproteobacteria bacterium]
SRTLEELRGSPARPTEAVRMSVLAPSTGPWLRSQASSLRKSRNRLIVVSNRLPVVFRTGDDGRLRSEPGSGGLVTALAPVLRDRGGIWIGWPGTTAGRGEIDRAVADASEQLGYALKPVILSAAEIQGFYHGFANEILWPLFHDLEMLCNYEPRYWQTYREANRRFAEMICETAQAGDFLWIHDYHLMGVAAELRRLGVKSRIGFFLHVPFPPLDTFLKLPWGMSLIKELLECDLIGLQTLRDQRNLVQCLQFLCKEIQVQAKGEVVKATTRDREVKIGHFPISIDYQAFHTQAANPLVANKVEALRDRLSDRKLIFSVDRLDYTKGIPYRLQAFRSALARYPALRGRISLLQVVVPSRVNIPEYAKLKTAIEQLVGEINGEWARPGDWLPVWYVFGCLSRLDLVTYYRAADISLVTPLKDGMNLVAKEYCACSTDETGVLILSEFAGAAEQLGSSALLINPCDTEGMAEAIYRAYGMTGDERRRRMHRLQQSIRKHDVFWWAEEFLRAAAATEVSTLQDAEERVRKPVFDHVFRPQPGRPLPRSHTPRPASLPTQLGKAF